jgi:prolipoprotein diacylglyceryl transferase
MNAAVASALFGSIPSPSSNSLHLGPLRLNAYGLMIALGVIAAVWLMGRRMEKAGIGTRDDASGMAIWAVLAGVAGARLYHVVTSYKEGGFPGHFWKIFAVWQGGLGIPGGLLAGILVAIWWLRRHTIPVAQALTAGAPALPLAQAIGRWGNWWNQELFGRPSTLPWALRIDPDKRPAAYATVSTFTPTFLYESLGNLAICGLLLLIERRFKLRPGRLLACYLALYAFLRFFVEGLRIDDAHKGLGLRLNQWVALGVFLLATGFLIADHFRKHEEPVVVEVPDEAEADAE